MDEARHEQESTPAERLAQKFDEDFAWLLRQPQFRTWLWEVVDGGSWCAAHAVRVDTRDVNQTFLDAGRRSVGVQLLNEAQRLDHSLYQRMLTEVRNLRIQVGALKAKD